VPARLDDEAAQCGEVDAEVLGDDGIGALGEC
jgi:hypothetical protein